MSAINYRGYTIQPSEGIPGKTEYFQEGEVTRFADSVTEAKREIDEEILGQGWFTRSKDGIQYFHAWLDSAMMYANIYGHNPEFTFNAP
jgi:hypothetical protein